MIELNIFKKIVLITDAKVQKMLQALQEIIDIQDDSGRKLRIYLKSCDITVKYIFPYETSLVILFL